MDLFRCLFSTVVAVLGFRLTKVQSWRRCGFGYMCGRWDGVVTSVSIFAETNESVFVDVVQDRTVRGALSHSAVDERCKYRG
jgi:hypothetical protein